MEELFLQQYERKANWDEGEFRKLIFGIPQVMRKFAVEEDKHERAVKREERLHRVANGEALEGDEAALQEEEDSMDEEEVLYNEQLRLQVQRRTYNVLFRMYNALEEQKRRHDERVRQEKEALAEKERQIAKQNAKMQGLRQKLDGSLIPNQRLLWRELNKTID